MPSLSMWKAFSGSGRASSSSAESANSRTMPEKVTSDDAHAHARTCAAISLEDTELVTGYMNKQSGRRQVWQERYFVLDTRTGVLTYYLNKKSREPQGVLHLELYGRCDRVHWYDERTADRIFTVYSRENNVRPYMFLTASKSDTDRWVRAIRQHIVPTSTKTEVPRVIETARVGGKTEEGFWSQIYRRVSLRARSS
eukprot:comp11720_c0_seq1/m.6300 comp11720_c0_seq1/g.6300  ORF comp11720_c0_seq1/g.6300 comp11720_c0_seq1/m.6300 type:complete len:197 (-) comp11720_c0_seq1:737-1327(-)